MSGRIPLIVSGDIHATAMGKMMRVGTTDLSKNPVIPIVPGTLGNTEQFRICRRDAEAAIQHPHHLDMVDAWPPFEENGFMLADFYKDRIELAFYVWNHKTQSVSDIPALESKHRATLRPAA